MHACHDLECLEPPMREKSDSNCLKQLKDLLSYTIERVECWKQTLGAEAYMTS